MEYRVSQLSSMLAIMAKCIWKSSKARLAWRATPSRGRYDKLEEGLGAHSRETIKEYAANGYTPLWMHKGVADPWFPKWQMGKPIEISG